MTPTPTPPVPFLKRIKIRNFKSIAYCDVELGPLTILVGRNGSGKSNFLDAIRFVGEAMSTPLDDAFARRGGFDTILHQANGKAERFSIELWFAPTTDDAKYSSDDAYIGFEIREDRVVAWEECWVRLANGERRGYKTINGVLQLSPPANFIEIDDHSLIFPIVALNQGLHAAGTTLPNSKFYNMNELLFKELRRPQRRDSSSTLAPDGSNLAVVADQLRAREPWMWQRLVQYLSAITTTIDWVETTPIADHVALEFGESDRKACALGSEEPVFQREMYASSMSDGTLRALATLVAINPLANGKNPVRLVGVEEPESGLHPAAAGVLMSALREAAESRQIVVTTQSDDLLDRYDPETDRLLVAEMRDGATEIAPVNQASREIVERQLYTAGEMLRMDQLRPDWEELQKQKPGAASEPAGANQ